MTRKDRDEYYFLTEKLDEISWAIKGGCNDIDCDKYLYKYLLKKKYRPVLEHNFSCMEHLKRDRAAVMRLLSQKKFRKYRYLACPVCKKLLDKLDDRNKIVNFTRPSPTHEKYHEWKGVWAHGSCVSKVKTPEGWKKMFRE